MKTYIYTQHGTQTLDWSQTLSAEDAADLHLTMIDAFEQPNTYRCDKCSDNGCEDCDEDIRAEAKYSEYLWRREHECDPVEDERYWRKVGVR